MPRGVPSSSLFCCLPFISMNQQHNGHRKNPTPTSEDKAKRMRARIGGLSLHVKRDSYAIAKNARKGFDKKFVDEALAIDPSLTGRRLDKKVQLLRNLYFTKLAARRQSKRSHRGAAK